MNVRQRITLGAIGGITPYLVTLLSIDFKVVVSGYELLDWVGLIVRCIVLIFLGSLVAYLHKSESEPFKLFQLGLAAPALLATFINGNLGNSQALPSPLPDVADQKITLFSQAYADEKTFVNSGRFNKPKVSGVSRFLRGAFGVKLKTFGESSYFVIVGSHTNREDAEKQAKNLSKRNYIGKVFAPFGASKKFTVAIASHVSKQEAIQIREQAIKDGLPKGSYVWNY